MPIRIVATAACICALSILPAQAGNLTGLANFGYGHSKGDQNTESFGGSANYATDIPGYNFQFNAGDQHTTVTPVTIDAVQVRGDAFWRGDMGTFGGSFAYHNVSASAFGVGGSADLESYGAFSEWYTAPNLTLALSGGGTSGSVHAGYVSVGAQYYFNNNFSTAIQYDYMRATTDSHTVTFVGEYMPFESFPVSFGLQYSYSEGGGSSSSVFGFGLRYRFGAVGGSSMSDWDRKGPIEWNGAFQL